MGTKQRLHRTERGAAAVEFGLVALLLITLLFGIIQFGFWFWAWQAAGHAAREASRVGAVTPCDTAKITSTGTTDLNGTPTSVAPTVTVTKTSPVKVGDTITVHVHFVAVNMGFFPGFDGVVDKSSTSRVENVPAGGC